MHPAALLERTIVAFALPIDDASCGTLDMTTPTSTRFTFAQVAYSHRQPEVPQPLLYSKPGFQILGDGTVLIAPPSDSTDGPTHAHRLTKEVLRREDHETREFILKAIEGNQTGLDIPALREELRLDKTKMDALHDMFARSPLRRLSAEPPPCSPIEEVVQALQQEVKCLHACLSMRDVLMLAKFGAKEIARRTSDEQVLAKHKARDLYVRLTSDFFKDQSLDNDSVLERERGLVEMQIDQLVNPSDTLAPLLRARARVLDIGLSQATAPPLVQQEKRDLANRIKFVYADLLGQCFSLNDGPQYVHHVLQHHVCVALDMLESEGLPGQGSPTVRQMQSADRVAEQADSSKKRKAEQLGAPSATELSIEQSRQQARADELQVSATARAMLTGEFELQRGLRCLQHAFNNGWSNWLALHRPEMPFVKLSLSDEAQELGSIDYVPAPDGYPMQRLRLMPRQLRALMPELEAHLDLAIVFKGPTNLQFKDSQVHQTHHYTALIKVNGMHFELESMAADAQAGKRWLPNLRVYLEGLQGGAYMAIRGGDGHPLSKYVKLMAVETFWKTCEALGALLGTQPIIQLAKFLPVDRMQDAARHIDADFAAHVCRVGLPFPDAKSHETDVPSGNGRSKAIVNWLDTLGTNQAILWTGTDPMVMAVERVSSGAWFAHDTRHASPISLLHVLDEQQSLFKGLAPHEHKKRAGFARALTLVAPAANASWPAVQSAVQQQQQQQQQQRPVRAATVEVQSLSRSGEEELAESEKTLLYAFKQYRYQKDQWTKTLSTFDTSTQIVDFLLNIKLETRMLEALLTISRAWLKSEHVPCSQHVAVLYLLQGRSNSGGDLLTLLPTKVPPCLLPYASNIIANVLSWKQTKKLGVLVLNQLGLQQAPSAN
jgi:hypothetical protein